MTAPEPDVPPWTDVDRYAREVAAQWSADTLAGRHNNVTPLLRDALSRLVGAVAMTSPHPATELPHPDTEDDGQLRWITRHGFDVLLDLSAPQSSWPKFAVSGTEMHRDAVVELRNALNAALARADR